MNRIARLYSPTTRAACATTLALALVAIAPMSPRTDTLGAQTSSRLRAWADRAGVWGSLGLGRANAGLSCVACTDQRTSAYALHGALGVRLSDSFLVGVETGAWLDVFGAGVDRIARGTYLVARSYPLATHRAFVAGGLGVASFAVDDDDASFRLRAPSLSLGVGFDVRLGAMTLTPSLTAVASTGGNRRSTETGNTVTDGARLGMLRTSVALSWFR